MSSFPEKLADRYRRFHHRHFLPKAEEYEELATHGQSPEAMVISCSDSRVDPETIFSAMPGEMFVVRNVANLVPPYETGGKFHGVSSAIEFAVLNLRIKHLIVMGHSGCGGVKAALDQSAAIQTEAQFISRWMSMLDDARLQGARRASDRAAQRAAGRRWRRRASRPPSATCAPSRSSPRRRTRGGCRCTAPTSTSPPARCRCSTTPATSSSRCSGSGISRRHPRALSTRTQLSAAPAAEQLRCHQGRACEAGSRPCGHDIHAARSGAERRPAARAMAGMSFCSMLCGVTGPTCLKTISPLPFSTNVSGMP